MKKIVMIFAAMVAVLSSCSKSELESVSVNDGKDIVLNISVSNPGADDTKALIKTGWAANDEISIWYDTNNGTDPDLVIEYDASNTKWIQKQGTTVSGNTPSEGDGKYAKALYNGKVKVASKDNYTYDGTTLTFNIANWKFLTEVQVVVKNLTSGKASDYTLACDKFTPLASTGNGYTVSADGITASKGDKGTAVTGISNTDGVAFVFATADYSSSSTDKKNFTFTLKDNTTSGTEVKTFYEPYIAIEAKEGKSSIKALKIENTKFVEVPYVEIKMTVGGTKKTYKWAKWNIGATSETDYGDYYAWGTTVKAYSAVDYSKTTGAFTFVSSNPYGDIYKNSWDASKGFNWINTPFTKGEYSSENNKKVFTKYVPAGMKTTYGNDGDGGNFYDDKIVLDPDDDVAHKVLGGNWRMPTEAEFKALFSLTKEWKTNYKGSGVNGYEFKDADGNSIFLPAAGNGAAQNGTADEGTDLSGVGLYGSYWCSSLYTYAPCYAYYIYFYSSGPNTNFDHRYYGRSVRAISE